MEPLWMRQYWHSSTCWVSLCVAGPCPCLGHGHIGLVLCLTPDLVGCNDRLIDWCLAWGLVTWLTPHPWWYVPVFWAINEGTRTSHWSTGRLLSCSLSGDVIKESVLSCLLVLSIVCFSVANNHPKMTGGSASCSVFFISRKEQHSLFVSFENRNLSVWLLASSTVVLWIQRDPIQTVTPSLSHT